MKSFLKESYVNRKMEAAIYRTIWFYLTIFIGMFYYNNSFAQIIPITTTTDQIAVVGATVTFNCSVETTEFYEITWEIDWLDGNESISCDNSSDMAIWNHRGQYEIIYTASKHGMEKHYSCILTITGITQADAGSFYCTLTPTGNITFSGKDVISNEVITNFELSVVQCSVSLFNTPEVVLYADISDGIQIDFVCNVSGNIETDITWLDSKDNMLSTQQDHGVLNRTFMLSDNNDNFTCLIKPKASALYKHDKGDVSACRAMLPLIEITPLKSMETISVMEGANVTIQCSNQNKISSEYISEHVWFHNDIRISLYDSVFKINKRDNLCESSIEILHVGRHLNLSLFTCEVHTAFGIVEIKTTELFVIQEIKGTLAVGSRQMGLPLTFGIITVLAFAVFIIFAVSLKFYRAQGPKEAKQDDVELKEIKGNGLINGHINPAMCEIDEDFPDSVSLSEDHLGIDIVTGRRKSSLFRESFADLWKGSNMNLDNMSDTSSVSLPSFAAVSRSRPDLLIDHSEEYKESTLKSHPPLSARVSAPASFTFSEKRTSFDVDNDIQAALPEYDTEIIDNNVESSKEEVNTVPNGDDFVVEPRLSQVSQVKNMSIPSFTISLPDEDQ